MQEHMQTGNQLILYHDVSWNIRQRLNDSVLPTPNCNLIWWSLVRGRTYHWLIYFVTWMNEFGSRTRSVKGMNLKHIFFALNMISPTLKLYLIPNSQLSLILPAPRIMQNHDEKTVTKKTRVFSSRLLASIPDIASNYFFPLPDRVEMEPW